jgi:hypothetical protein
MAYNYIPNSIDGFHERLHGIHNYTVGQTSGAYPVWSHILPAAMDEFGVHVSSWSAAKKTAEDDPTSANRHERNRVMAVSGKFLRTFVNRYLRNEPVTSLDRDNMGIPNRSAHLTPVPAPTSRALLYKVKQVGASAVHFHFKDEHVEKSQAIPYGYSGCLVSFHVGPERVDDMTQLKETRLFTASPARLQLPLETEGQWLSMNSRWQLKKKGILGPIGPVQHVRVV